MPSAIRRAYGDLDRAQVVASLHNLARRVGVQQVTMRELAAELGAAVPSVYYHVPGKQAALDLLAESVLAEIPVPQAGPWDARLTELYCAAREVIVSVPGIAGILQTSAGGERARRLDRLSRSLLAEAGLSKPVAAAAHTVLYTYLLGSVSLRNPAASVRPPPVFAPDSTSSSRESSGLTPHERAEVAVPGRGEPGHRSRPRCRRGAGPRHIRRRRPVRRIDPAARQLTRPARAADRIAQGVAADPARRRAAGSRDTDTFTSSKGNTLVEVEAAPTSAMLPGIDPPRHVHYRKLINQGFTVRNVQRLESRMRTVARDIVTNITEKGEFDAVPDISAEMSLQVIADVLGVPAEDRMSVFRWSNAIGSLGIEDPDYAPTPQALGQGRRGNVHLLRRTRGAPTQARPHRRHLVGVARRGGRRRKAQP